MIWIHAQRVSASTLRMMMVDVMPIRDRSNVEFPTEPVRVMLLIVELEIPVSTTCLMACPEPTSVVGFVDVSPKQFLSGIRFVNHRCQRLAFAGLGIMRLTQAFGVVTLIAAREATHLHQ